MHYLGAVLSLLLQPFFSCPILLFLFTPLWWGLTVIKVSFLYFGLFIHSSQLLHRRLSLVADNVSTGCRVVVVELHGRRSDQLQRANLIKLHSLSHRGICHNSFSWDERLRDSRCATPSLNFWQKLIMIGDFIEFLLRMSPNQLMLTFSQKIWIYNSKPDWAF